MLSKAKLTVLALKGFWLWLVLVLVIQRPYIPQRPERLIIMLQQVSNWQYHNLLPPPPLPLPPPHLQSFSLTLSDLGASCWRRRANWPKRHYRCQPFGKPLHQGDCSQLIRYSSIPQHYAAEERSTL